MGTTRKPRNEVRDAYRADIRQKLNMLIVLKLDGKDLHVDSPTDRRVVVNTLVNFIEKREEAYLPWLKVAEKATANIATTKSEKIDDPDDAELDALIDAMEAVAPT